MFCDNKERVRIAGDVRASALRALELQPGHDLALHVLGRCEHGKTKPNRARRGVVGQLPSNRIPHPI